MEVESMASPGIRTVVLAPHADDEVMGCGGRLYGNAGATVIFMTNPGRRILELRDARKILGYGDAIMLDYPDGALRADREVVKRLDEILADIRPHILLLPSPDLHQDHIATYEAGMRSARLGHTSGRAYIPRVELYEVPSYDIALKPALYPWNIYAALEPEALDAKAKAMEAYASQIPYLDHPAARLREHAIALGSARRVPAAERYALVREVTSL